MVAALSYGYYAVSPIAGSTSERGTDAMLVSVAKPATEIQLKSAYPTLNKTVDYTATVHERGRARVDGLDLGVYLLHRTVTGRPGTVVEPALVDGSISMCVEVHPKFGAKPSAPPSRPGTDIPTTGDVVMAAGICMLIAGSVMFVAGHLLASRRADV